MALYFNGTLIPENGGEIKYDDTDLTKIYFCGVKVWEKSSLNNWAFSPASAQVYLYRDDIFWVKSNGNKFWIELENPNIPAIWCDGHISLDADTGRFSGQTLIDTIDGDRDLSFSLKADEDGGLFFEGDGRNFLNIFNPDAPNRIRFDPATKVFVGEQTIILYWAPTCQWGVKIEVNQGNSLAFTFSNSVIDEGFTILSFNEE